MPTITSPAAGSALAGEIAVTATSTAPQVQFQAPGAANPVLAPVVGGHATALLPLWGYSGPISLMATDCNTTGCATNSDQVQGTVTNAPISFSAPTDGAKVGTSVAALVNSGGGGMLFLLDGTEVDRIAAGPYTSTIDTSAASVGTHTLDAIQCTVTGFCGGPAATAQIEVVNKLAPKITRMSADPFSPNRDGRLDTTTFTYTLDEPQSVVLRIRNRDGNVVRGPVSLGSKPAGTHTWTFNGKTNGGKFLTHGAYVARLDTTGSIGDTPVTGQAQRAFSIDLRPSTASSGSASPSTLYPVRDSYRDTATLRARLSAGVASMKVQVLNGRGRVVRTLDGGSQGSGTRSVKWNGRTAGGSLVDAGGYRFRFVLRDSAGNMSTSASWPVTVSHKRLVRKTGTKTVTPLASHVDQLIGACSVVEYPAREGWKGSFAYKSNYEVCWDPSDVEMVAITKHAVTLPAALRYGTVKVTTYGARRLPGFPDVGAVLYETRGGDISDYGAGLGADERWWPGDKANASGYVTAGRKFRWWAGTTLGNYYDIKSFKVTWTYYVLR